MWELDYKESWALKNWCFQTVVLETTLDSCLDWKNPKGNLPWIFIGRTDAKAPILRPPDANNWLIGQRPWRWERLKAGGEGDDRGQNGWMASLTQWTWVWVNLGVGDGQGGLMLCGPWGRKEPGMTGWLNWTKCCSVNVLTKNCLCIVYTHNDFLKIPLNSINGLKIYTYFRCFWCIFKCQHLYMSMYLSLYFCQLTILMYFNPF